MQVCKHQQHDKITDCWISKLAWQIWQGFGPPYIPKIGWKWCERLWDGHCHILGRCMGVSEHNFKCWKMCKVQCKFSFCGQTFTQEMVWKVQSSRTFRMQQSFLSILSMSIFTSNHEKQAQMLTHSLKCGWTLCSWFAPHLSCSITKLKIIWGTINWRNVLENVKNYHWLFVGFLELKRARMCHCKLTHTMPKSIAESREASHFPLQESELPASGDPLLQFFKTDPRNEFQKAECQLSADQSKKDAVRKKWKMACNGSCKNLWGDEVQFQKSTELCRNSQFGWANSRWTVKWQAEQWDSWIFPLRKCKPLIQRLSTDES